MNRRKAIQQIGIFAISARYFAACDFSKLPEGILDSEQRKFLQAFSNLILPYNNLDIKTPETVVDFILTVVTECKSAEEIKTFQDGLTGIQKSATANFKNLQGLQQKNIDGWINELLKSDNVAIPTTLAIVKDLSVEHFTTSEFYLKNHTDYEFIPGRFKGCVEI